LRQKRSMKTAKLFVMKN